MTKEEAIIAMVNGNMVIRAGTIFAFDGRSFYNIISNASIDPFLLPKGNYVLCGETSEYGVSKAERDKILVNKMGRPNAGYNFSTWTGFGALWEWAKKAEWFDLFQCTLYYSDYEPGDEKLDNDQVMMNEYIDPDKFAYAVLEFLKLYK